MVHCTVCPTPSIKAQAAPLNCLSLENLLNRFTVVNDVVIYSIHNSYMTDTEDY